ncbi:hypothetical protein SAMN04488122_6684 [Chitinophaga arvensicola]|uniref:Uncharacterized protein n=1 Tax=Chitinophaga arvensicola TaxID=29529 RepID=A0A1I0SDZ5_9BACT|nr:hypothetical protein SAMN04488122_6684 [Chitinophaga arvensicola]
MEQLEGRKTMMAAVLHFTLWRSKIFDVVVLNAISFA